MNTRSSFASGKGNAAATKKTSGNDALKLKRTALKRVTLEINNRTRIDKNTRSRFISKRPISRTLAKSRRKASPPPEHFEDQAEKSNDSDTHDDSEFIDVDDNDASDPSQTRRPRSRTTRIQNLEKYHADLRRQLKIKKMKKQLNINSTQRTLPSSSHLLNFLPAVLSALGLQNLYFQDVFSLYDLTNSYLGSSNSWALIGHAAFATETRTSFLLNNNLEYSRVERKFPSVSLRILKNVYSDTLNFRNLSKFFFSWTAFSVLADARAEIFKNFHILLASLEVYCNVMLDFAHPGIRYELDYVMSQYRLRILRAYIYKTWSSILAWHEESLARIIRTDQNIAVNWIIKHDIIEWMLKDIVVIGSSQKSTNS